MAPSHRTGFGAKVVVAGGLEPGEQGVDLDLAADEGWSAASFLFGILCMDIDSGSGLVAGAVWYVIDHSLNRTREPSPIVRRMIAITRGS